MSSADDAVEYVDVYEAHAEQEDLDKAEQRHAHEQVQVSTDGADERVDGDARLLVHLCVGERLVEEAHLDHIRLVVVHKVALGAASAHQCRRLGERGLRVRAAARIVVAAHRNLKRGLVALERTLAQAIRVEELEEQELAEAELGLARVLLVRQAVVELARVVARAVRAAVALGRQIVHVAELGADVARVLVAGGDHLLEKLTGARERVHELVVLVDQALAVGKGPRVVLLVEGARDREVVAEGGRDCVGRLAVPVGIGGLVEDEHVEGLENAGAGVVLGVGEARVQLERDAREVARKERLLVGDGRARGVVAAIEAVAVAEARMKDELEVTWNI